VKAICDRVIVLKDGELVREAPIAEIEPAEMARAMVAASFERSFRRKGRQKARWSWRSAALTSPGTFADVSSRSGRARSWASRVSSERTDGRPPKR